MEIWLLISFGGKCKIKQSEKFSLWCCTIRRQGVESPKKVTIGNYNALFSVYSKRVREKNVKIR